MTKREMTHFLFEKGEMSYEMFLYEHFVDMLRC